jgi:PAS domain S-box-containing protein
MPCFAPIECGPSERINLRVQFNPKGAGDIPVTGTGSIETAGSFSESAADRLAAAAAVGLWQVDVASGGLAFSETFAQLFGLDQTAELDITAIYLMIHRHDRSRTQLEIEKCSRDGSQLHCEFRVGTEGDPPRWVALHGGPVTDRAGTVIGFGGLAQDVTRDHALAQQREDLLEREINLREAAESANQAKDEFVALVSHELRAPLNAMLGWARILQTKQIDAATLKHAVETIERSARAQSKLIEDLIDSARISTGKLRLELHLVDLKRVVGAAADIARPAAEAKQVGLTVTLHDAPIRVVGDADRLQQVVGNLLSNAVKFTPGGGRAEVELRRTESTVEIVVRDSGMGIGADDLPRIFDRFDQAGHVNTRRHGGLGLGLSLVRQLVELHGGSVRAESAGEGKGSTFFIQLRASTSPLPSADTLIGEPALKLNSNGQPKDERTAPLGGLNILVVDDDQDARDLTAMLLSQNGASVRKAASAAEAFSTLAASADFLPDLLLSDIGMPDEDGFSLIIRVRALATGCGGDVPAIALTAFGSPEDRERALKSGFNAHLTKPIEPHLLITQIARLAAKSKQP